MGLSTLLLLRVNLSLLTTVVGILTLRAAADNCTISPLVLPITNVTFPDGIGVNRGIRLVLGGQVQGLRLSTTLNNTRVRNVLDCPSNSSGRIRCEGSSGSVYSTTDSTFKQVFSLKDWNVSVVDPRPKDGTTVLQGFDVANFTDGAATVPNFPFEVWANHDALNKSALALGPKSSVLDRFVTNGLAPSAAFGLDYGSRSELYARDGQLIIGGVNEGRHDSQFKAAYPMWAYAAPIDCPLQVLLQEVVLTNAEGDHSLLDDPGSTVTACVDTIQNAFTWTPAMFQTWQRLTRWTASDADGSYTQQTYPANREPFIGNLTIKLANGYTTTIPHYELVTHERGPDAQGKYAVINNTRIMAAVQSGTSDLGYNVPVLGGVFLSQNYLHVDYAARSFWLSPQIGNGSVPDQIVTSCSTGNSTSSGPSSAMGVDNSKLGLQAGLPVAFVVVAISLIAYFMVMRNRRRNKAKYEPRPVYQGSRDSQEQVWHTYAHHRRVSELAADVPAQTRHSQVQAALFPAKEVVDILVNKLPSERTGEADTAREGMQPDSTPPLVPLARNKTF